MKAPCKVAFVNVAPSASTPPATAPVRFAPSRAALTRLALGMFAWVRFAFCSCAPARFALGRLAFFRSHPAQSTPGVGGGVTSPVWGSTVGHITVARAGADLAAIAGAAKAHAARIASTWAPRQRVISSLSRACPSTRQHYDTV